MKKLLIILIVLFSFFSFESKAQTQVHVDRTGYVYDWKLSNQACYGCGSFYVSVERTTYADEKGLYWFYVYFWNNSYYGNGNIASTYVTNINVYGVDVKRGKYLITGPFYFVVLPKTNSFDGYNLAATIYSYDPYQVLNITWGQVTAY